MTDLNAIRATAQQVVADAEKDAKELEGAPFNGATMGNGFGVTLAMVWALGRMVDHLAEHVQQLEAKAAADV